MGPLSMRSRAANRQRPTSLPRGCRTPELLDRWARGSNWTASNQQLRWPALTWVVAAGGHPGSSHPL